MHRHLRRAIGYLIIALVIAATSISVGLAVTPDQQVQAVGQTIEVGVTGPSTQLSGPGELDLFGQKLDTSVEFVGPIRPRIRLTQIALSEQLRDFTSVTSGKGAAESLSSALVTGFRHYLYWQIALVALVAIMLAGAVCGWLRKGWGFSLAFVASVLVVTEIINIGAIMSTAYTAPAKLGDVHSLQALVGDAPELRVPPPTTARVASDSIVVIGDSTAAGLGNGTCPMPPGPTRRVVAASTPSPLRSPTSVILRSRTSPAAERRSALASSGPRASGLSSCRRNWANERWRRRPPSSSASGQTTSDGPTSSWSVRSRSAVRTTRSRRLTSSTSPTSASTISSSYLHCRHFPRSRRS